MSAPTPYEKAGGIILRDLFDEDRGGWYQDPALLEQLVFEKLKIDAEALKAEGWKWVDAAIDFPYGHSSGMRRIYGEPREPSADELARHDAVKAEYDKLDAEYAEAEDYDGEVEDRLEKLGAELDALNDRPIVYEPDEVARAGVFVTLGADGKLRIERGFIRPEDEPVADAEDGEPDEQRGIDDANGEPASGVVVNGRPASDRTAEEEEDETMRPLPDRLVFDLTAQRTLALRNALAADPALAFTAALHALVLQVFYRFASDTCLELSLKSASFSQAEGLGETVWAKEIDERQQDWGRDLPKDEGELWEFLIGLDEASRQALFAHCVSLSLNAVMEPWNKRPRALAHAGIGWSSSPGREVNPHAATGRYSERIDALVGGTRRRAGFIREVILGEGEREPDKEHAQGAETGVRSAPPSARGFARFFCAIGLTRSRWTSRRTGREHGCRTARHARSFS